MDRQLLKPLLLVASVLVLPLVLLVIQGESFVGVYARWRETPPDNRLLAALAVVALASDVFLPIPSGPICTFVGSRLGFWNGTAVSTLGTTLGAIIAFALARRWGRPLATCMCSAGQLAAAEAACRDHAGWALAMTRPLPVLAEACALLTGALQLSWRQFLPPVVVANCALAACYSALGERAAEQGWLPAAVGLAAAAPLVAWLWLSRIQAAKPDPPAENR